MTRSTTIRTTALVLASALLAASTSVVEAREGSDKERSRQYFERAELLYRQAEFRKALAAYKQAMTYKRYPAYLFNIAQCHRQLGQYKQARFFFKLFLSEKPDTANRAEVLRRVAEMERQLATLEDRRKGRLSLTTDPAGAAIYVDDINGKPLATSPATVLLAPGQHVVLVRRDGYQDEQRVVMIRSGQVAVLKLGLRLPVSARRQLTLRTGTEDSVVPKPYYKRWWFWTGMSIALLATGAAIYTGTTTLQLRSKWDDNQGAPVDDPNLLSRGKAYRTATDVLIGTAAVFAVATIIGTIVVTDHSKERARAVVAPACDGHGCGLWVSGRF